MTKIDRKAWVSAALAGLDEGKYPPEIVIKDLSAELRVTSGSFYQHFKNAQDWYAATTVEWGTARRQRSSDVVHYGRQFRDPVERIKSYRAAAKTTAAPDRAMRTWAASADAFNPNPGAPEAEKALDIARQPILEALAFDLSHLGLGDKASLAARALLREFGLGPGGPSIPLDDDDDFAELLGFFVVAPKAVKLPVEDLAGSRTVAHIVVLQPPGAGPIDAEDLAERTAEIFGPALRAAAEVPTAAAADG
jgi:hypothetical protein